jgi:hypothetical protein
MDSIEYGFRTLCSRDAKENFIRFFFFFNFNFITARDRVNYAIKVSINGDDGEFDDARDRIMNSSKDVVCKLISHIPVIMVTLGDKGLLVCITTSISNIYLQSGTYIIQCTKTLKDYKTDKYIY